MNFSAERRCYLFSLLSFIFLSFASSESSHSSSSNNNNNNITIIGTMGGFIYGIDSHSLEKKWTINTGGPLLSAEQVRIHT
jgi:hypothetical protein